MKRDNKRVSFRTKRPPEPADPVEGFPLPIVDLDGKGTIVRVNRAACLLYQTEPENLLGHPLWDFMAMDDVQGSRAAFFRLVEDGGEPTTVRRTFRSQKGLFRTCDVYRCYRYDARGQRIGLRAAYIDVTESAQAFEACLQGGQWIRNLLASISEAVVAVDPLGFITYVNPAAEQLIGWTAQELEGKPIERALPLLDQETGDEAILALERALDRRVRAETLLFNGEGEQLNIEINSAPIIDRASGSTTGVISVIRRLKERR